MNADVAPMVERLLETQRDDSSNLSISTKKEYHHKWHQDNKEKRLPIIIQQTKDRKEKYKQRINEIKNVSCKDCGNRFHPHAMDFDHLESINKHEILRPVNKLKAGSGMVRFAIRFGWDKFLEEIAKCEIVCSNCHRMRTYNRSNNIVL